MERVLIVGGGLTGLVAAEQLKRAGAPAVVLEREAEPGGACRSLRADGYVFDYTGHLLHVARAETQTYLAELGVWDQLAVHERRAAVVIGGRATPYPVQINTHGLAADVRRDCLLGFVRAWGRDGGEEPADFRAWVLDRFGEGLARYFFFPYNSKLYRAAPEELSLDWVGRYVP
jgi:protoporphyrinogen oxidase